MIKGFRGTSLVDYPGKICAVVYTYKCNFRCPYCYNLELILPEEYHKLENISEDWIIEELIKRKGFIKGLAITGGEPTIWNKKLVHFIERVKFEADLSVKLDTNGSNPEILKYLIENKIIDFIAMDFKTSPEKYKLVGGDFKKIEESLEILKSFTDNSEIRITLYPDLVSMEDLEKMLPYLQGIQHIALQKYLSEKTYISNPPLPYSQEIYDKFYFYLKEKLPSAEIIKRY